MLQNRVPFFGYRTTPRPRHDVAPLVVLLLRPFFQYSEWRDAFILRVVGERYGPVLRPAPGRGFALRAGTARHRAGTARHRRGRRLPPAAGTRAPATLLVPLGIAVAAVLGFLIARAATGGSSASGLGRPVPAGALEASLPNGWQVRSARQLASLGLVDGIGAASGARLIAVGAARTTDPTLLPAGILGSLPKTPPAQLVTLRGTTFYRYSDLPLRGRTGSQSVYATPTPSGTVLAVCRTPSPDAGFASTCQRVVESIQLRSGSLSPGLVPAYASTLRTVIGKLNRARAEWGSQLSTAQSAGVQASAASRLAAAHAQAAAALEGLHPGPARSGNDALIAALRTAAAAYTALARAASGAQVSDYGTATDAIARASDALQAAQARLRSFGYPVS